MGAKIARHPKASAVLDAESGALSNMLPTSAQARASVDENNNKLADARTYLNLFGWHDYS